MAVKREVDRMVASEGNEMSNLKSIGDLIRAGTHQEKNLLSVYCCVQCMFIIFVSYQHTQHTEICNEQPGQILCSTQTRTGHKICTVASVSCLYS